MQIQKYIHVLNIHNNECMTLCVCVLFYVFSNRFSAGLSLAPCASSTGLAAPARGVANAAPCAARRWDPPESQRRWPRHWIGVRKIGLGTPHISMVPSGKHTKNYGTSPCLMGKSW